MASFTSRKQKTRIEDWGLRIDVWGLTYEDWGLMYEVWGMMIEVWGLRYEWWWGIMFFCCCFFSGPFQPTELVLENRPEKWNFWLFSNRIFLESWDQARNESPEIFRIRGQLRSWEVIKGQIWKWTEPRHMIPFWKPQEVSMLDSYWLLVQVTIWGR